MLPQQTTPVMDFPAVPVGWFYLGRKRDFGNKPVRFDLPGTQGYVGYNATQGRCVVLSRRCSHMAADLAAGEVKGDRIVCPLHGWQYGPDGHCQFIPATSDIPNFACQVSFPVEEIGGHVFFHNTLQPKFPLPFFEDVDPDELVGARAFEFVVEAPWHFVSANGFDAQHFRCAHDRTLIGDLTIDCPHPFARRLQAEFEVAGESLSDGILRRIAGTKVKMTVTNWGGNLVLVSAKFARTTTYGLVSFIPLVGGRTLLRDVVWKRKRKGWPGRVLADPIDLTIRRRLIREFVRSDVDRSHGIRLAPQRSIPADKELVEYLSWLARVSQSAGQ